MKIGFIGFGKVANTLSKKLLENNMDVYTSTKGRSQKTKELARDSGVKIIGSYEELAKQSDILISSTSPKSALAIAQKYGVLVNGVFIDLNNISPETTMKIAEIFDENSFNSINENNFKTSFLDGAIIGKVSSENAVIIVSGEDSDKIAILNDYGINVKILSQKIGDVSTIKMLRSIYTKGITATLYETFLVAEHLDLSNELFDIIAISEGENFKSRSKSRLKNLTTSKSRKFEEMDEVLDFLKSIYEDNELEFNSIMSEAAQKKFKK